MNSFDPDVVTCGDDVLVRLLVERKLEFEPTMVTPIVLAVMAGVALGLSRTPPALAWFARNH